MVNFGRPSKLHVLLHSFSVMEMKEKMYPMALLWLWAVMLVLVWYLKWKYVEVEAMRLRRYDSLHLPLRRF